jgi:hypothetical protein
VFSLRGARGYNLLFAVFPSETLFRSGGPRRARGLGHAAIVFPDTASRDTAAEAAGAAEARDDGLLVRDPSGNALLLGV